MKISLRSGTRWIVIILFLALIFPLGLVGAGLTQWKTMAAMKNSIAQMMKQAFVGSGVAKNATHITLLKKPNSSQSETTTKTVTEQQSVNEEQNVAPEISKIIERQREAKEQNIKYDQPDKAAEYYRLQRLPQETKEIPVENYLRAREQMREMVHYSTAQNRFIQNGTGGYAAETEAASEALGTWTPLGPNNVGGRTRALLIHPTTPSIMYAAGVSGGVWKTTNGGGNWSPLTELIANIAVSSLAFDPSNPNIIYAGTGEGFFAYGSIRGAGIFKSTDGGTTWQQIARTNNNDNFYYVNKIIISPNNSQRIYAATKNGVWRSLNGGVSWVQTLNGDSIAGGCQDMVIRTDKTSDYIVASCGTFQQAQVFRNTDAANTNNWPVVLTEPMMGRTALALAPSNQNIIYASASSVDKGSEYQHGLHAVFRSSSSGDAGSWTKQVQNTDPNKLNTLILSNPLLATLRDCGFVGQNQMDSQGWYDNTIAVDPKDENRVWVGGIDLFRSDDGGVNWGLASHWWASKSSPQYAHANHHIIAFHPGYDGLTNKQMYVGNDGGIFFTNDARADVAVGANATCNSANTKVAWRSMNNNYSVTQFFHGTVYPDGKTYFGGTHNNGTIRGSDAKGAEGWEYLLSGDGAQVAVDPTNTDILFASYPGGRFRKSTDGGLTFSRSMFGLKDDQFLFITPLTLDPSDPQHLWTGGSSLWRTDKGAANCTRASKQTDIKVSAIAVAPTDSNYVLAGGVGSGILRTETALTTDSETVWQTAYPRAGFVSSLAFDPTNPNIAYATYSTFGGAHVWKSVNASVSWTSIDGSGIGTLPDIPVNCLVVDPTNTARLFIGTDMGVFVSTNSGLTWNIENAGFANVPIASLSINTFNGASSLYAFTHGRGVWRVTLGNGCNTTLLRASQTFTKAGGSGSVNVNNSCAWTASVNQSGAGWITITSVTGTTVNYTVAANTQNKPRVGTLAIAGKSFSIVQPNVIGSFSSRDAILPVVTITTPDPAQTVRSNTKFITLKGTATDDRAVSELYFINDRDGKKIPITNFTGANWETPLQIYGGSNHLIIYARDAVGNVGTAKITLVYNELRSIITLAGTGNGVDIGGYGGDGSPASGAQLKAPRGLVLDAAGNLFFADSGNHRIRKITPTKIITTVAGNGTAGFSGDGGQATSASLNAPYGVALDAAGNLYIGDEGNRRVRKVTPQGIISTVAGNGSFSNNIVGDGGLATQAELNQPRGLAFDATGNLYIGDAQLGRIRKVAVDTGIITTIAGAGAAGATDEGASALTANLGTVTDLVIDATGNIYFTQGTAATSKLKKIGIDGMVTTFSNLLSVTGIALDKNGNLFATSFAGGLVYKLNADGSSVIVAGSGNALSGGTTSFGDGGSPTDAIVYQPIDVAVDAAGSLYISDGVHRIRKVLDMPASDAAVPTIAILVPTSNPTYTTTSATLRVSGTSHDNVDITHVTWSNNRGGSGVCIGTGVWSSALDLAADILLQPGINTLTFTAWDLSGNAARSTLTVNYNPPRVVTTLAGTLTNGFSGENVAGSIAQLWSPQSVAVDNAGIVYIADRGNHVIRRVTPDGNITTFAGTGQLGSSGDGGSAKDASFNEPMSLAFDVAGNLYVADSQNNRIRKITMTGMITTFVGTGAQDFSGDGGPAARASLNLPSAIAIDKSGNLYIADTNNNRIRKVTAGGIISSIAGTNVDGFKGDGGPAVAAEINAPTGIAVDATGNVYISDTSNHLIRKISTNGIISTVLGTGTVGFSGENGLGTNAQLNAPSGLAVDGAGNVYVADQLNHRICRLGTDGKVSTVVGSGISGTNVGGTDARTIQLNAPGGLAVDAQGNFFIADTENHRVVRVKNNLSITSVNCTHYYGNLPVAPESVVAAFGPALASKLIVNDKLPLPTQLDNVQIKVRDSAGVERLAPLYFISQYQINYQIPKGTAYGIATITILNGTTVVASEALAIAPTQPGFFTANSDGRGAAASSLLLIKGSNRWTDANYTCPNICVPKPIDINAVDAVYIELFGTGIRYHSGMTNVKATIGGIEMPVLYAGAHCCFVGVDQVNLQIPKALAGRGEVDIILTVDGKVANEVKINVK